MEDGAGDSPADGGKKGKGGRGSGGAKEWKRKKDEERKRKEDERAAAAAAAGPAETPYPCQICSLRFTSKNQLFKHLRSGGECSRLTGDGGHPNVAKKEKVVLLLGYLADRFQSEDGLQYIAQHGCIGEIGADTTDTVYKDGSLEHALFRALDTVRGAEPPAPSSAGSKQIERESYTMTGRAPKFSRAARCDKGVHGGLNYVSLLTEQLPYGLKPQRFVDQLNDALKPITGDDLKVFARIGVKADFHAKISCDRKQYSVVIPMKALLPASEQVNQE